MLQKPMLIIFVTGLIIIGAMGAIGLWYEHKREAQIIAPSPTDFDGFSFTVFLPDGTETCLSVNTIPPTLNNNEKAFLIQRLRNTIEDVTFEEWEKYQ